MISEFAMFKVIVEITDRLNKQEEFIGKLHKMVLDLYVATDTPIIEGDKC